MRWYFNVYRDDHDQWVGSAHFDRPTADQTAKRVTHKGVVKRVYVLVVKSKNVKEYRA